jgi:hypothetical protein
MEAFGVEVFSLGMPCPYKCVVEVHDECNVLSIQVDKILRYAQPLSCIKQPIVPFRECRVVEGSFI